jgi:SPP1 gp7 family putative phage head morphogenesis protein
VTVNERLRSTILRRAVRATQMENGTVRRVRSELAILARLLVDQVRRHSDVFVRSGATIMGLPHPDRLARLRALLPVTHTTIREHLTQIATEVYADLLAYGRLELIDVPQTLQSAADRGVEDSGMLSEAEEPRPTYSAASVGLSFSGVPAQQVAELLLTPGGGSFFQLTLGRLTLQLQTQLQSILLGGLMRGEGVAAVARAVRAAIGGTRTQAERIVRSEYVRISAQSTLLTAQRNAALLDGVQWLATLDARTCLQCAELDGRIWKDSSSAPLPVASTHPNCRCVLVPIVKLAASLGLPPAARASFAGPVEGGVTYREWFGQQSEEFQKEVLGPTRYRLWKSGQAKLGDFATARGVRDVRDVLARFGGRTV